VLSDKSDIRKNFKTDVFERDKYSCRVCGHVYGPERADSCLDSHHILDRNSEEFNGTGGYVKENGISLCKNPINPDLQSCHLRAEKFHISGGEKWEPGLHPDDLYKIIGSTKELAIQASEKLK